MKKALFFVLAILSLKDSTLLCKNISSEFDPQRPVIHIYNNISTEGSLLGSIFKYGFFFVIAWEGGARFFNFPEFGFFKTVLKPLLNWLKDQARDTVIQCATYLRSSNNFGIRMLVIWFVDPLINRYFREPLPKKELSKQMFGSKNDNTQPLEQLRSEESADVLLSGEKKYAEQISQKIINNNRKHVPLNQMHAVQPLPIDFNGIPVVVPSPFGMPEEPGPRSRFFMMPDRIADLKTSEYISLPALNEKKRQLLAKNATLAEQFLQTQLQQDSNDPKKQELIIALYPVYNDPKTHYSKFANLAERTQEYVRGIFFVRAKRSVQSLLRPTKSLIDENTKILLFMHALHYRFEHDQVFEWSIMSPLILNKARL